MDGKLIHHPGSTNNHHGKPSAPRQPRNVITEEEYTSTLNHIVTRDYFPSLHSLRRDAAILDARSRGDIAGAVAIRRAARKDELEREREWQEDMEEEEAVTGQRNDITPFGGVVNAAVVNGTNIRKRPRPLKHESVTGFHARVTSEDNAEFEMNQERERREREGRLGLIYEARADKGGRLLIESGINKNENGNGTSTSVAAIENKPSSRAFLGCDTPLGLASDLYNASPTAGLRITDGSGKDVKSSGPDSSNGIGRNGLFFQPLHHDPIQPGGATDNLLLTAKNSSGGKFLALSPPNSSPEKGRPDEISDNLLMPPPPARLLNSSDPSIRTTGDNPEQSNGMVPYNSTNTKSFGTQSENQISSVALRNSQLVEYIPKPSLPDIYPPATRFPYQSESRLLPANPSGFSAAHSTSSSNALGLHTDTSDTTDLDASPPPLSLERAAHQKARLRENETFVEMTPLIQPGGGGTSNDDLSEPIMTWGDVASTPLVLGSGNAIDRGQSSAGWEPTRPSLSLESNIAQSEHSAPSFDLVDDNSRESLARCAEKTLLDRGKTYRSAGSKGLLNRSSKRRREDNESVESTSRLKTTSALSDRKSTLTPAARALLEACSNAYNSKKSSKLGSRSSASSRIFQSTPSSSSSSVRASNNLNCNAGSKDSFGSALRKSYTPNATPSRGRTNGRNSTSSSSSLRRAAGGATPRCHSKK